MQVLWSADHKVATFDYPSVMKDEREMYNWLVKLETDGATVMKNVPPTAAAAYELCENVAKVKYTHFG